MSDLDALLAAVHAAPDDDAPRLIFADWLEENGHPERAEFMRIQYEMKRVHAETGRLTPRLEALFVRQKQLFQLEWARPLRECGQSAVATFNRGFPVDHYLAPAAKFLEHLPALVAWLGPRAEVRVQNAAGHLPQLGRLPALSRLRKFFIVRSGRTGPRVPTPECVAFLRSPWLGNLTELGLSDLGFTAEIAAGIADCPSLAALEWLHLDGNPLGPDGLVRLAGCPNLRKLMILDVQNTEATEAGVAALLASPHLPRLERVYASRNEVSDRFRAGLPAERRAVLELLAAPRFGPAGAP